MVILTTPNRRLDGSLWYASQGWKILPCNGITTTGLCTCNAKHTDPKDIGKHAVIGKWQDAATSDAGTIEGWFRINNDYNPAVMCSKSGFFVIDIDPRSGGFESFQKFEELVEGDIPKTVTAITGQYASGRQMIRGKHLYFKVDGNEKLIGKLESISKDLRGVDIKHNGYVLLPPSRHLSGVEYQWAEGCAPWEIPMASASEKMMSALRKGNKSSASSGEYVRNGTDWSFVGDLSWNGKKLDIQSFLTDGLREGSRGVDIYAMACALANKFGTDLIGREAVISTMQKFNAQMVHPPLELHGQGGLMGHVENAIAFVHANPSTDFQARKAGFPDQKSLIEYSSSALSGFERKNIRPVETQSVDTGVVFTGDVDEVDERVAKDILANVSLSRDVDALSSEDGGTMGCRTFTDTGNGRRLVDSFGKDFRYTPGLGWFHWNRHYWMPDVEELSIRELTKRLGSVIAAEASGQEDSDAHKAALTWAKQAKSNARQSAAIESATSDPRIGVAVEDWDRDPVLLGVANGVVDLRSGTLMKGRQDLQITRRAPVAYRAGHTSSRFQEFLDFATDGDKEYQEWLQKAFGYTLTGLRTYDVMFLVYGPPGSGKNVLIESLVKCLGTKQYAFPLDSQILAQGDGKSSSADLYHWAELRGRRMIWVDELPESERLKENSVKKLTGSSEISARSPGEKPFTFESQGKLWITTNHRPVITDDAMWRRIRPIPWMRTPSTPDPTLKAYLHDPEGGLPAVLAWAVEGAMKLLASKEIDALGWCGAVSEAAEVYRKNEDRMGMFLDEETTEDVLASSPIKHLFMAYQGWSEDRGERAMSQIAFTRKLQDRGLQLVGNGGRAVVLGRKVNPPTQTAPISWDMAQRMAKN